MDSLKGTSKAREEKVINDSLYINGIASRCRENRKRFISIFLALWDLLLYPHLKANKGDVLIHQIGQEMLLLTSVGGKMKLISKCSIFLD